MKIHLAGYNIDTTVIDELTESVSARHDVTPEVISASYARISRDPRSIDELRKDARNEVEKARKSNKSIIFQMGHHSIAEHAVFNFDIIGVSRYAIESIEKFRLCSFTEKSQRYITLNDEWILPEEINNSNFAKEFSGLVNELNGAYSQFYDKLKPYVFSKHKDLAQDSKKANLLEGWAKEDARYITPLATLGQLGLTVNARNLELMCRRFASSAVEEVRQIGVAIFKLVEKVAPSIILFPEANEYDKETYNDIADFASAVLNAEPKGAQDEVNLVDYDSNGDEVVLASLLHTVSCSSFAECLKTVRSFSHDKKIELIKNAFKRMKFYDTALREFEFADLTYELSVSAACFGQLKRHRMTTITSQMYDPSLGVTVPDSIKAAGMDKKFLELTERSQNLFQKIADAKMFAAAPYALTNAHRRRVLLKTNVRELYHIARLREDAHAQWDIQNISGLMSAHAKRVMPYSCMLICGKDRFDEAYQQVFGKKN